MLHVAVDERLIQGCSKFVFQTSTQAGNAGAFLGHLKACDLAGFSESDDAGNVQRTRPHAALVSAAIDDCRKLYARVLATHIQSANAFRAVSLVGREGHQVDFLLFQVDLYFAGRLSCVAMENDAFLAAQLANFLDRLDHANLIIDQHDRDQDSIRANRFFQLSDGNETIVLRLQISRFIAFAF